jgi:polyisoprenoid-binding protein YceI
VGAHRKQIAQPALPAGTWEVDPARSAVSFQVRHLGVSSVRGRFTRVRGTLRCDGETLRVEGSVEAASVDTADRRRDRFLCSADFFDAERHPRLVFTCSSPPPTRGARHELEGELRIRSVTRPLALLTSWESPDGDGRLGVRARGELRRGDYGLRFPTVGGFGDALVGETVTIVIDAAAVRI